MSILDGLAPSRVAPSSVARPERRAAVVREPRLDLGDPGRCPGYSCLTICLFDDSGSVAGPTGADPVSNRYQEATLAFQRLARRCRCGRCQAAVVHFDLVGSCSPTRLARRVPRPLLEALAVPSQGAGTSFIGPGLAAVARLVEDADDARELALVAFSDFELFDTDVDRLLGDLAHFPGRIHAVVLGGRRDLVLDPNVQITRLTAESAPGATARALLRSLTASRPGARVPDEPTLGSRS